MAAAAWGRGRFACTFLELAASEEPPADVMAALFALLCLGSGSLSDARRIVRIDDEVAELLERSYVYVGVDRVRGTFCAAPFGVPQIAQAFSDRLANLGASAHEDAGAFVLRLAEAPWMLGAVPGLARSCAVWHPLTCAAPGLLRKTAGCAMRRAF